MKSVEDLRREAVEAGQERFCPTASMLLANDPSPEREAHLESCALCRHRLEDAGRLASEQAWEKLSDLVNEGILAAAGTPAPLPGQVWIVAERHGGWGAYDKYYHAPQVIILDVFPYPVVRVAHISTAAAFFGRGDYALFRDPARGFAEMWNQYSLPASWLDMCIGKISGRDLAACRFTETLAEEPEEGSPLDIFRQQELYHSLHFSRGAVEEVMRLAEEGKRGEGGAVTLRLPKVKNSHPPRFFAGLEVIVADAAAAGRDYTCPEKRLRVEIGDGRATLSNDGDEDLCVRFVDKEGFILPVTRRGLAARARETGRELPEYAGLDSADVASFVLVKAGYDVTVSLDAEALAEEGGIIIL